MSNELPDWLFRGTRWRGADDAYSVPLGDDRTLWLFGDSFVAADGASTRVGSAFVHNTIAVQTGLDPAAAAMDFRWGETVEGPADYFPGDPDSGVYLWPGDGKRTGEHLLVFFMDVGPPSATASEDSVWDQIPFQITGWRARRLVGVDGPPDGWRWEDARLPSRSRGVVGAALVVVDDYLHAFCQDQRRAVLCRWPLAAADAGDLTAPEWWTASGWGRDVDRAVVVLDPAETEFTVHRVGSQFCLVDIAPFAVPETAVHVRLAERLQGPWSERREIQRLPEASRAGIFVYAGKAHPELIHDGLLATYASNTSSMDSIWGDETLYYPRFIRIDLAALVGR